MALGLTEQALYYKIEVRPINKFTELINPQVTLPSGRVVPFSFPLRVTVDKIKVWIHKFLITASLDRDFFHVPRIRYLFETRLHAGIEFSRLSVYKISLVQDERLEIEFIKFMHAHPKIESAISSDEVIRLQLYIKNKEKRSESISLSTTPLHHHVRRQ